MPRLEPSQRAEIHHLKDLGYSQVEIARRTGLARSTVQVVIHQSPDHEPEIAISRYHQGPIERCPGCGRKMYMPCLACRIESARNLS